MEEKEKSATSDAWYTEGGMESDVILSTRLQLSRNLANFPFPSKNNPEDAERVMALVFDAFNSLENADEFQSVPVSCLDTLGSKILKERGILPGFYDGESAGIILKVNGKVSCTVNLEDHIRISCFSSGQNFDEVFKEVQYLDDSLQKKLQFAASYDFGYLTSSVENAGSGMKLFVRIHLPSLSFKKRTAFVAAELMKDDIVMSSSFGNGTLGPVSSGLDSVGALGGYFDISLRNSIAGSELDQIAGIAASVQKLKKLERECRTDCKENRSSEVKNYIFRSIALARYSLFMSLKEAVAIISCVKWAKDLNYIEGIDYTSLHALLYRIQDGHLSYVARNNALNFGNEISSDSMKKSERIRALILQEAFEDIQLIV